MPTTLTQRKEEETRQRKAVLAALARGFMQDCHPAALVERVVSAPLEAGWRDTLALTPHQSELRQEQQGPKVHDGLERLLRVVAVRAPQLLLANRSAGPNFLCALGLLAGQQRSWVREPAAFRPKCWKPERAFGELARHLLALYPVPRFLDGLFLRPCPQTPAHWFAHLATGGSPVELPGLTLPLTRRMGYCFLHPPEEVTVLQALRYGQMRGLGEDVQLADAVCRSFLGNQVESRTQEEWWLTVFGWLSRQGEVDPGKVAMLLGYLQNRRDEEPGFAIAGRSLRLLLAEAEVWREYSPSSEVPRSQRFEPSGVKGGEWELGEGLEQTTWRVKEILDMRTLCAEGRAMRHCVASYAPEILSGDCSIWSLQVSGIWSTQRAVTIQVDPETRRIVEVRGKQNRDPTPQEMAVIERWASEADLTPDYDEQW